MYALEGAHELHDQAGTWILARGCGTIARLVYLDNIGLLSNIVTEVEELRKQVKDLFDKVGLQLHELEVYPRKGSTVCMVLDIEVLQTRPLLKAAV